MGSTLHGLGGLCVVMTCRPSCPIVQSLSNFGLRLVLGKSKTTGPDKVQKEVSVHIFRTASLTGEDWLKAGYDLWSAGPFNFRRDYLVMEPNKTWTGRRRFLPPSGLSAAIAKLLGSISCPRRTALGWELMPAAHLVPDGLEAFFSGHSPEELFDLSSCCPWVPEGRACLSWAVEHVDGVIGRVREDITSGHLQDPEGCQQGAGGRVR